ncbi:MAG: hypothetical protein U0X39_09360 [Bacteroidales bacterium]
MKKLMTVAIITVLIAAAGCTKIDNGGKNVKDSIESGANNLSSALEKISTTGGYQMLSSSSLNLKSELAYNDSITLDLVSGEYKFSPDPFHHRNFFIPYRLFRKIGESDSMIVHMPNKLAFRPSYLHSLNAPDSVLKADFTISAYDYQYLYSWNSKYDYKLGAAFTLDKTDAGRLTVESTKNRENGRYNSSTYVFKEGYKLNTSSQSGDTTETSFTLTDKEGNVLIEELVTRVKSGYHSRESIYSLTLGDVTIKRGTGLDSIEVYLDGVLQKTAGAKIVDSTDSDGSVCHHRDILLTFDDGTTQKLSELLDPVKETLKTLVDSLHSMNFAKNVVDWIAISIYYHSHIH